MTRRARPLRRLATWLRIDEAAERRRLRRLSTLGVLWSGMVIALELPLRRDDTVSGLDVVSMLVMQAVQWGSTGLVLAIALFWATRGTLRWSRLVATIAVCALQGASSACLLTLAWPHLFGPNPMERVTQHPVPLPALFVYTGWISLTYGTLGVLVYASRRRIEQNASALRTATLARERNEAAIAEARLRAMVERIEPRFLFDVMAAARDQYAHDRARAEATLNACVDFLRTALPQIRSGRSSIAAELDVTEAYLRLRDVAGLNAHRWRIDRPDVAGTDPRASAALATAVPPLALLPLVEQLLATPCVDDRDAAALVIGAAVAVDRVELRIDATAPADGAAASAVDCLGSIEERLRLGCGGGASVRMDEAVASTRTFRIVVPVDRGATAAASAASSSPPAAADASPPPFRFEPTEDRA